MVIDVGMVIVFFELDIFKFLNGIVVVGVDLKNFVIGGGLDNLSSVMEGVGSILIKGVILLIVGVGVVFVKIVMDFEV